MMAFAQVVEMSVNINNSPSQDYTTNPDDHSNHKLDYSMFFAFEVWRIADVLSVDPSSEQSSALASKPNERRRANARNVSYTPNLTGEKHTISTLIQLTRQHRKTVF